jgi:hypothetical protein
MSPTPKYNCYFLTNSQHLLLYIIIRRENEAFSPIISQHFCMSALLTTERFMPTILNKATFPVVLQKVLYEGNKPIFYLSVQGVALLRDDFFGSCLSVYYSDCVAIAYPNKTEIFLKCGTVRQNYRSSCG